jgi:hypothetical protein
MIFLAFNRIPFKDYIKTIGNKCLFFCKEFKIIYFDFFFFLFWILYISNVI